MYVAVAAGLLASTAGLATGPWEALAVTVLQELARQYGLKPASELDPLVEPRTSPLSFSAPIAAPDFVVIDVETACDRASSICQIYLH